MHGKVNLVANPRFFIMVFGQLATGNPLVEAKRRFVFFIHSPAKSQNGQVQMTSFLLVLLDLLATYSLSLIYFKFRLKLIQLNFMSYMLYSRFKVQHNGNHSKRKRTCSPYSMMLFNKWQMGRREKRKQQQPSPQTRSRS